jgi:hypothetical protein
MRKYYTLCERMGETARWYPAFGDYDLQTVKDELRDMRDSGIRAKNLKILTSDESQDSINSEIRKLNAANLL